MLPDCLVAVDALKLLPEDGLVDGEGAADVDEGSPPPAHILPLNPGEQQDQVTDYTAWSS